jgi:hypothetical protein
MPDLHCQYCRSRFTSCSKLAQHSRRHIVTPKCQLCAAYFDTDEALLAPGSCITELWPLKCCHNDLGHLAIDQERSRLALRNGLDLTSKRDRSRLQSPRRMIGEEQDDLGSPLWASQLLLLQQSSLLLFMLRLLTL